MGDFGRLDFHQQLLLEILQFMTLPLRPTNQTTSDDQHRRLHVAVTISPLKNNYNKYRINIIKI